MRRSVVLLAACIAFFGTHSAYAQPVARQEVRQANDNVDKEAPTQAEKQEIESFKKRMVEQNEWLHQEWLSLYGYEKEFVHPYPDGLNYLGDELAERIGQEREAGHPIKWAANKMYQKPKPGQKVQQKTDKVDKSNDFPPPGDYPHSFEIGQKYDKFRDKTTLELDFGKVWSDTNNALQMHVLQWFDGEGRNGQSSGTLVKFMNKGHDGWRYLEHHPIIFLVDGERMKFEPEHHGSIGDGYVLEHLWVQPSKDQFIKMLHAKEVQIRVGVDQFDLTDSQFNALKDYFSYLGTPARRLSTIDDKKNLREARLLETKGLDADAGAAYQRIIGLASGSYEEAEANNGIKRLDDPVRKDAYKKSMEKHAKAKAALKRLMDENDTRSKIERSLRLGQMLEERNPKAALTYYKEILKLSADLSPKPPEVEKARSRIKALSATGENKGAP